MTGATVAGLAVLAAAGVFAGLQLAERKQARRVQVKVQALAVAADAAALDRGRYLFTSRGCVDCHGANGGGRVFVEKGDDLRIKGPNITRGEGGVVARYRGEDWVGPSATAWHRTGAPRWSCPARTTTASPTSTWRPWWPTSRRCRRRSRWPKA